MSTDDRALLEQLERRIRIMLPEQYQDSYETVQPVPMRSAGLKYGDDGKVQWDEMWASFCDLAMAGGPPHKGAWLDGGTAAEIAAQPDRHTVVVSEICRGIRLVTDLPVHQSPLPGWVRMQCLDDTMAQWLMRAVVMENVAARAEGMFLDLPASPSFRLEKEIKNVITVAAKTCHYWIDHVWDAHQALIGELMTTIDKESPLVEPALPNESAALRDRVVTTIATAVEQSINLPVIGDRYANWIGIDYRAVSEAIWMMRAMVISNVLSRREDTILFLPINPETDDGQRVVSALVQTHRMAVVKGALSATRKAALPDCEQP